MSNRNMEVVPGSRAPVLSRALLARTHELNRDYVALLLAERSLPSPGCSTEVLPARVLDALFQLDNAARYALSACPYTLFSLAFDDQPFWTTALEHRAPDPCAEADPAERYGTLSTSPMHSAFCEVALFLAWHTAQTQPLAARFLFAMPTRIAESLADAPMWRIRRVALDYPGLLTPRWPRNPALWPDLVRFAAAADARLEAAQLLGNQLIASELDGSLPRAGRQRIGLRVRRREI